MVIRGCRCRVRRRSPQTYVLPSVTKFLPMLAGSVWRTDDSVKTDFVYFARPMRFAYLRPAFVLVLLVAATLLPNVARSQSQTSVYSLFPASATPSRPGGTDQLSVEL